MAGMVDIKDRIREIEATVTLINSICYDVEMTIVAKKICGRHCVCIHDNITELEYAITYK